MAEGDPQTPVGPTSCKAMGRGNREVSGLGEQVGGTDMPGWIS
jgi:hypothetical protein